MKKFVPIDLPKDLTGLIEGYSDEIKNMLREKQEKALKENAWDRPLDLAINSRDFDFIAYWLNKTGKPHLKPRLGYDFESYFKPFKKTEYDLTPANFKEETAFKMSASGDLMFAAHISESKNRLFSEVEDIIFTDKYAFANLESTLSEEEVKEFVVKEEGDTPFINITVDQYEALVRHKNCKFDVLQIANNHILDCGVGSAKLTIEQLKKDQIDFIGVYESKEDSESVTVTEVNGIKIGWVSHTYSLNEKILPEGKEWMCNYTPFHKFDGTDVDVSKIEEQIKRAKESCDLVFLALHWGLEFELFPHPQQLEWAHQFAELGADALIGHHPHVAQPFEIYTTTSGRKVPILYSLGNLTPAFGPAHTVASLVANLDIAKGVLDGEKVCLITGLKIDAIAFMGEMVDGNIQSALVPLNNLNKMELDQETRAYVEEINNYIGHIIELE
jgi:poly-gamma-glutamate synthesis protein (capsule biosynthesis protein)